MSKLMLLPALLLMLTFAPGGAADAERVILFEHAGEAELGVVLLDLVVPPGYVDAAFDVTCSATYLALVVSPTEPSGAGPWVVECQGNEARSRVTSALPAGSYRAAVVHAATVTTAGFGPFPAGLSDASYTIVLSAVASP